VTAGLQHSIQRASRTWSLGEITCSGHERGDLGYNLSIKKIPGPIIPQLASQARRPLRRVIDTDPRLPDDDMHSLQRRDENMYREGSHCRIDDSEVTVVLSNLRTFCASILAIGCVSRFCSYSNLWNGSVCLLEYAEILLDTQQVTFEGHCRCRLSTACQRLSSAMCCS
jgi:hypothetical protein